MNNENTIANKVICNKFLSESYYKFQFRKITKEQFREDCRVIRYLFENLNKEKEKFMREVNCPNCNRKLGEINEEDVKPSQARVSIGMIIIPYTCPICGKTHMQTIIQ